MTSVLRRGRPFLASLPFNDPSRATRDLLRKNTEKFFLPFVQPRRSCADLASYRFRENLSNVLVPAIIDNSTKLNPPSGAASLSGGGGIAPLCDEGSFLCAAQLNGEVGTSRLFEDLFHVILSGFDVVHVHVENQDGSSMMSALQDPCHFRGFLVLAHTRPFLGWQPSLIEMPKDVFAKELSPFHAQVCSTPEGRCYFQLHSHDILPFAAETPDAVRLPMTFKVPFSTHAEGAFTKGRSNFLLSHMNLRLRLVDALCADPESRDTLGVAGNCLGTPPDDVVEALNNKTAMKLLAGLRRLGVRPELITAETLLSASVQKAAAAETLTAL